MQGQDSKEKRSRMVIECTVSSMKDKGMMTTKDNDENPPI